MEQRQEMISYGMPDIAVMQILGRQLKQMRLNAQMSQNQLAEQAGLSRSTITQLETGKGGTISSLIAILRCLRKLNVLDSFATSAPISPLAVARNKGRIPQRIYKPNSQPTSSLAAENRPQSTEW